MRMVRGRTGVGQSGSGRVSTYIFLESQTPDQGSQPHPWTLLRWSRPVQQQGVLLASAPWVPVASCPLSRDSPKCLPTAKRP